MTLSDKIEWCVSRLVDNYEWPDFMEYDEWMNIQKALAGAILSDKARAEQLVQLCLDQGVIEEEV